MAVGEVGGGGVVIITHFKEAFALPGLILSLGGA